MSERPGNHEGLSHWEGEPLRVWSELWGVPRLEAYRRISSTNDRVRELAAEGAPTLTTVLAEEQTAGRGRGGRSWDAASGAALLISFLLRPPGGGARAVAPLVLGIAVARALEGATGAPAGIKWPNDVLLQGRKAAGVLCEAGHGGGPDDVVAGVGINVRQKREDFPADFRDRAVSLEEVRGGAVSRAGLAGSLLREVQSLFSPGPEKLEGELARELAARDALKGRRIQLEDGLRGRVVGVGPAGALLLDTGREEVRILAGTVRELDEAEP